MIYTKYLDISSAARLSEAAGSAPITTIGAGWLTLTRVMLSPATLMEPARRISVPAALHDLARMCCLLPASSLCGPRTLAAHCRGAVHGVINIPRVRSPRSATNTGSARLSRRDGARPGSPNTCSVRALAPDVVPTRLATSTRVGGRVGRRLA